MALLARRSKMQTKQLEQLNHQIEVRASKVKNLALRNQWQQAKTIKNCQSEYNRIRNHLNDNTLIPNTTRLQVNNIKKPLGRSRKYIMKRTKKL